MESKGAPRKPEEWLDFDWLPVFETLYNVKRGFLGFDEAFSGGLT